MTVMEIERQIRSLNSADKIHLIQSIAEMLKKNPEEALLNELSKAAGSLNGGTNGPLEAYEAAAQLQEFLKQESL